MSMSPVQLAASGLTIASDTIILGLTVMKTITISLDAHKFGLKTPVATLLLRDGRFSLILSPPN